MTGSFIPTRDSSFDDWAHGFMTSVEADPAEYGLTAEEIAALRGEVTQWDSKYTGMIQQHDAARGATVGKDQSRKTLEATLRSFARKIQGDPAVSDQLKADAGLPVHSTSRNPVPVPKNAPAAIITDCNIQEQSIRFADSTNPNSRSRPRGVFGVEIYQYIGESLPLSDDQFVMLTTVTRMKATINFEGDDGGKTAFYRFRYINTRGEVGPWSTVYSSMIMK